VKRARRILLVVAGAVAVLTVVCLLWPREHEPGYQGKKLSEWLTLYSSGLPLGTDSPQKKAAREAVRHIGTNAVPVLLAWLDYDPSAWRRKLTSAANRLPGHWDQSALLERLLGGKAEMQARLAVLGFEILGPEARCAVPELGQLMLTRTSQSGDMAVLALVLIGKEGLPPLVAALTNSQALKRSLAAGLIGFIMPGPAKTNALNAADAVPALVQCLGDKDQLVAGNAARTLGQLGILPNIVVPALTKALSDTRPGIRGCATWALAQFSQDARSAIPAISAALNDPDLSVRKAATNALQQITREAGNNF
jgi:HEAT repeat protein